MQFSSSSFTVVRSSLLGESPQEPSRFCATLQQGGPSRETLHIQFRNGHTALSKGFPPTSPAILLSLMEMTSKAESLMKGYGVSVFRLPAWGSLLCVLLTDPITRMYIYILNVLCTGVDLGLAQDQRISCFTLPSTQHIPIEQHGNRLCK